VLRSRGSARRVVPAFVLASVLVACSADEVPSSNDHAPEDRGVIAEQDTSDAAPAVRIEGSRVVLDVAATEHTVAELTATDGAPVHATLRPSSTDRHTVLLLTRVADGPARYELRYATVDLAADGSVKTTDLYWFPWRSQIDEYSAAVLDVPPIPVWAPDGSAVAWIEWTDTGTRLRTVGWFEDGVSDNPSDLVTTYRLDEIPAGTQLERWVVPDPELDAVLIARGADAARYRIEVAPRPA
jgi:hypothetical protein